MSDLRIYGLTSPSFSADGGWRAGWGVNDGSSVVMPWQQAYINAGFGFHVSIGAFSTPITGGGNGTVIDQNQPEGILSIPSGAAIIPIRIAVQTHIPLLATDADESEILIAVDKDTAYAGDGTVTAETPYNLRMNATNTSGVTAASAATGDITNPTLDIELARSLVTGDVQGTPATALWTKNELLYEPRFAPVLFGPCALYIYWGGTVATTGYAEIDYIEFTSAQAAKLF